MATSNKMTDFYILKEWDKYLSVSCGDMEQVSKVISVIVSFTPDTDFRVEFSERYIIVSKYKGG